MPRIREARARRRRSSAPPAEAAITTPNRRVVPSPGARIRRPRPDDRFHVRRAASADGISTSLPERTVSGENDRDVDKVRAAVGEDEGPLLESCHPLALDGRCDAAGAGSARSKDWGVAGRRALDYFPRGSRLAVPARVHAEGRDRFASPAVCGGASTHQLLSGPGAPRPGRRESGSRAGRARVGDRRTAKRRPAVTVHRAPATVRGRNPTAHRSAS